MNKNSSFLTNTPIAHRGLFNGMYPENSLGAFKNAINNGYAIELDVHMTKDGSIVVFHDYDLERMTGIPGNVDELLKSSLKDYKLLNTGYSIPLFEEVLSLVAGKTGILIEIKSGSYPGRLEKELCRMLSEYKGEFAIQSFSPFSIGRVKRISPNYIRGILASDFKDDPGVPGYRKFVSKNFSFNFWAKPDFIAYDINSFPSERVEEMRKSGHPVLGYTINSGEKLEKARQYCDNIIFEGIWNGR